MTQWTDGWMDGRMDRRTDRWKTFGGIGRPINEDDLKKDALNTDDDMALASGVCLFIL